MEAPQRGVWGQSHPVFLFVFWGEPPPQQDILSDLPHVGVGHLFKNKDFLKQDPFNYGSEIRKSEKVYFLENDIPFDCDGKENSLDTSLEPYRSWTMLSEDWIAH